MSHGTFEKYCYERFGFERRNAYRLIEAAEVAENVSHGTQTVNERQAREVAKAPAELQSNVVDRAVAIANERGKKPTAAIMREACQEVVAAANPPRPAIADGPLTIDVSPAPCLPKTPNRISAMFERLREEILPYEWPILRDRLEEYFGEVVK